MGDEAARNLLARLSSGSVDAGWREFLDLYSPTLMYVIRRHAVDTERTAECFAHVCGALSDDHFRRLCSFNPDGPARFKTWLIAVVSNLCVDWRRRETGRIRPPQHVGHLPRLEQQVYRCIFLRNMSRAECVQALATEFPGLTVAKVSEINARLFGSLTPQQRWQLSTHRGVRNPVAYGVDPGYDYRLSELAAEEPGPDDAAASSQEQQRLEEALAKLPPDLRLLLRLRYEQNLTLAEVARLTGQPDPFRANRRIQAALDMLGDFMDCPSDGSRRKNR